MKNIPVIIILLVLLVGGTLIGSIWIRNNAIQAQSECSGSSPRGAAIHFEALKSEPTSVISETSAIALAKKNAAVGVDVEQVKIKAQLVDFSDDARGTADKIGDDDSVKLDYQHVSAWVVTFCGLNVPIIVPLGASDKMAKDVATHEWNVVINAKTGEYMEEFSFQ